MLKDDTFLSVIVNISERMVLLRSVIESNDQILSFLKVSLLIKTYNYRLEDNSLGKHHLLPFLTLKKRHCFHFPCSATLRGY